MKHRKITSTLGLLALTAASSAAMATCDQIFAKWNNSYFTAAVGVADNGGYGLPMWLTAVDETGKVCAIINSAGSGAAIGNSSWLGSRVISAQKANTVNAFSLNGFSISTSNLYGLTQPGGSLFGLQESNPVDATIAYLGLAANFGTGTSDPLAGKRIGGINVFGGGLALYSAGTKIGAIGVSGDTSCTDHAVAWRLRNLMGLDSVPGGFVSGSGLTPFAPIKGDEMIIKLSGSVANTYYQPSCAHNAILNPTQGAATGTIILP